MKRFYDRITLYVFSNLLVSRQQGFLDFGFFLNRFLALQEISSWVGPRTPSVRQSHCRGRPDVIDSVFHSQRCCYVSVGRFTISDWRFSRYFDNNISLLLLQYVSQIVNFAIFYALWHFFFTLFLRNCYFSSHQITITTTSTTITILFCIF